MIGTKRVVGLHFPMYEELGYRLMDGALRYAAQQPDLAVADFGYYRLEPPSAAPPAWTGKADGVLICGGHHTAGQSEWLARGGVPVVNTAADLLELPIPAAFIDPVALARLGVGHLAGLGYERFVHIGYGITVGSNLRQAALAAELKQRGLSFQTCDVAEALPYQPGGGAIFPESVKSGLCRQLESIARPFAVIVLNDHWGQALCELIGELGWRIPEDAAILSVGDTNRARTCSPPLSAIRAPHEQIGYEAARMLHRLLQGKRLAQRKLAVKATEIVARESTVANHRASTTEVDRALDLIRRHACEGIRVEDVIRQLRVSPRTLELQFAKAVGHSMGEEIRDIRLARAKELLSNTDLSLTRIAGLIGYASSAYFTEFFRQHGGMLPSEFRRRLNGF